LVSAPWEVYLDLCWKHQVNLEIQIVLTFTFFFTYKCRQGCPRCDWSQIRRVK
jgi:hypothetical protein